MNPFFGLGSNVSPQTPPGFAREGGAQGSPGLGSGLANLLGGLFGQRGFGGAQPQAPQPNPWGQAGGNPFAGNPILSHLFSGLGSNQGFYQPGGPGMMPQQPGLGILGPILGSILAGGQRQAQPVAQRPGQPSTPTPQAPQQPRPGFPGRGGMPVRREPIFGGVGNGFGGFGGNGRLMF